MSVCPVSIRRVRKVIVSRACAFFNDQPRDNGMQTECNRKLLDVAGNP